MTSLKFHNAIPGLEIVSPSPLQLPNANVNVRFTEGFLYMKEGEALSVEGILNGQEVTLSASYSPGIEIFNNHLVLEGVCIKIAVAADPDNSGVMILDSAASPQAVVTGVVKWGAAMVEDFLGVNSLVFNLSCEYAAGGNMGFVLDLKNEFTIDRLNLTVKQGMLGMEILPGEEALMIKLAGAIGLGDECKTLFEELLRNVFGGQITLPENPQFLYQRKFAFAGKDPIPADPMTPPEFQILPPVDSIDLNSLLPIDGINFESGIPSISVTWPETGSAPPNWGLSIRECILCFEDICALRLLKLHGNLNLAGAEDCISGKISFQQAGELQLAPMFSAILKANNGSKNVSGELEFKYCKEAADDVQTQLGLRFDHFALQESVDLLSLKARDITLLFKYNGTAWELGLEGTVCQSWNKIAKRSVGIALPCYSDMPDLKSHLQVKLTGQNGGLLKYRLELLRPGTGCQEGVEENPVNVPLGLMPVLISRGYFEISLQFDGTPQADWQLDWQLAGGGTLLTTGWLHDILDFESNFQVYGGGQDGQLKELCFQVEGENLSSLTMPSFNPGGENIKLFSLTLLRFCLSENMRIEGELSFCEMSNLTSSLNDTWTDFFNMFGEILSATCTLSISLPMPGSDSGTQNQRVQVEVACVRNITDDANDLLKFDLFDFIKKLGDWSNLVSHDSQDEAYEPENFTLLSVTPLEIRFCTELGGTESPFLKIIGRLGCVLLNESFDAELTFQLVNGEPEFSILAGKEDPIRLELSTNSTTFVVDDMLKQLYSLYDINDYIDANFNMADIANDLKGFFSQPGIDICAVFELYDIGLRVRPADPSNPVSIQGGVRPLQLPGFLDKIMPASPSVLLGSSPNALYIEIEVPDTQPEPLISIPFGQEKKIDFILHRFRFGYDWTTNAIDLQLSMDIDAQQVSAFDPAIGTEIVLPQTNDFPEVSSKFSIKTIMSSGAPVPIPEWSLNFGDPADETQRGLELVLGIQGQRLITLFQRRNAFSLSRLPGTPGFEFNGGFLIGNPPDPGNHDRFYIEGDCQGGTLLLFPPLLAGMLNPALLIPPFLSPMPPYWIIPPIYAGDIYFGQKDNKHKLVLCLNIPEPINFTFDLGIQKPIPELGLFEFLELAYIASRGFNLDLPHNSALRHVCFVKITGNSTLTLPAIFGNHQNLQLMDFDIEVNAADLLDGFMNMVQSVNRLLETASNLAEEASTLVGLWEKDPAFLIRMLPREKRQFSLTNSITLPFFHTACSGSVYLLTPEELLDELITFHQGKRLRRGVAALRLEAPRPAANATPALADKSQMDEEKTYIVDAKPFASNPNYIDLDSSRFREYKRLKAQEAKSGLVTSGEYKTLLVDVAALYQDALQGSDQKPSLWKELLRTTKGQVGIRQGLLAGYELKSESAYVEKLLEKYFSAPPRQKERVAEALRERFLNHLIENTETELIVEDIKWHKRPGAIAETLAKIIIPQPTLGQPVNLITREARLDAYRKHLRWQPTGATAGGDDGFEPSGDLISQIEEVIEETITQKLHPHVSRPDVLLHSHISPDWQDLENELRSKLEDIIKSHSVFREPMSFKGPDLPPQIESAIFQQINDHFSQHFNTVPKKEQIKVKVNHKATEMQTLLKQILGMSGPFVYEEADTKGPYPYKRHEDDGSLKKTRVDGFQIVPNPNGRFRDVAWAEAVGGPYSMIEVVCEGSEYYVREISENGESTLNAKLPDEITDPGNIPETPEKARQLRAELIIAPKLVEEELTDQDRKMRDDFVVDVLPPMPPAQGVSVLTTTLTTLPPSPASSAFAHSIFARPEYRIREARDGSSAMSLAELFVQPGYPDDSVVYEYAIPGKPILLAGFTVKLDILDATYDLKMAGIVSFDNDLFLYGYNEIEIAFFGYKLQLLGEFYILMGDLWKNTHFEKDSTRFKGFAKLLRGEKELFGGEGSGQLSSESACINLNIKININNAWEIIVGDQNIAKAWIKAKTSFTVEVDDKNLSFSGTSALDKAGYAYREYSIDLQKIVILRSVKVCCKVFGRRYCVSISEVFIMVPKICQSDWTEREILGASLNIKGDKDKLTFGIKLANGNLNPNDPVWISADSFVWEI